ncbi:MAG: PEP-CTERM sorting domain-containing protein, partial [Acidobacteria bacterium]|nr:PEP-CTERM sorting domain-containing protein [Acidobacteriota bacterium]
YQVVNYSKHKFFAIFALATSLSATTIKVQFINAPNGGTAERTVDGGTNWTSPGFSMLNMRIADSFNYLTFCLEPLQSVSASILDYNVVSLDQAATNIGGMGATKANFVRELIGRFYPNLNVALPDIQAGAMQMALWEIIREDKATYGFNVSTGLVRYRNENIAMMAQAQTYLNALDGTGPKAMNLIAYTNANQQDILFQTPEPATFALIGGALISLGALRRRQKN